MEATDAADNKDTIKDTKQPSQPPKRTATSMVAQHPPVDGTLQPLEKLAAECGMPAPALAGMCRAKGWAEGKQVTATEFESAMTAYIKRPMGSGRG